MYLSSIWWIKLCVITDTKREPASIVFTHGPIFGFLFFLTDQGEIGLLLPAKFHLDRLRGVGLRPQNFKN